MSLSLVLQIVLAGTAVAIPLLFPQQMIPKMVYQVMNVAQPQTDVPLPPKPPVIKPRVQPPPVEQPPPPEPQVAKLMAPPRIVAPQLKPKTVRSVAAPDMSANFTPVKMDDASDQPARPREPVKTGMLSTGSAAVPTINKPVDKVQTGGFGDPNGVPGPGNPNKAANVNRFGSPALPPDLAMETERVARMAHEAWLRAPASGTGSQTHLRVPAIHMARFRPAAFQTATQRPRRLRTKRRTRREP